MSDRVTRKRRDSHLAERRPGEPQPHLWRLPDVFREIRKNAVTGEVYFYFLLFVVFMVSSRKTF